MGNISPSLSQGQEVELENFPKGQAFKFDSLSGFTLFFFQQSPCQLPDGLFDFFLITSQKWLVIHNL